MRTEAGDVFVVDHPPGWGWSCPEGHEHERLEPAPTREEAKEALATHNAKECRMHTAKAADSIAVHALETIEYELDHHLADWLAVDEGRVTPEVQEQARKEVLEALHSFLHEESRNE